MRWFGAVGKQLSGPGSSLSAFESKGCINSVVQPKLESTSRHRRFDSGLRLVLERRESKQRHFFVIQICRSS